MLCDLEYCRILCLSVTQIGCHILRQCDLDCHILRQCDLDCHILRQRDLDCHILRQRALDCHILKQCDSTHHIQSLYQCSCVFFFVAFVGTVLTQILRFQIMWSYKSWKRYRTYVVESEKNLISFRTWI